MIKSIIFDFDGVILDSNEIKTNAFKELFKDVEKNKLDLIIDFHKNNMGISRYDKIRYYHNIILKKEINDNEINKIAENFSKLVFKKILKANFISGSENFIYQNYQKYLFYISSGTPENELIKICSQRGIDKYFHRIYGSQRKKNEHIKLIMKENIFQNNEVIFIGDSITDYNAALQSKISFIGINYKNAKHNKNFFYTNDFYKVNNIIENIDNHD